MKTLVFSIERRGTNGEMRNSGGFADRLKGVAFSFALSRLTGRRFYIDWSRPCPLSELMPPACQDWKTDGDKMARWATAPRFDWIDAGFTPELATKVAGSLDTLDHCLFGQAPDVVVHANSMKFESVAAHAAQLRDQGLKADSAMELFASAFEQLFSTERIKSQPAWKQYSAFRQQVPIIIGGQFRTGVGKDWRDPCLDSVENSEAFASAILRHAQRKGLHDFGVFFTSDNEAALRRIDAALPISVPRFHFPGERVHMERSPEESAKAGAMQIAVEHTILSECDHVVICQDPGHP